MVMHCGKNPFAQRRIWLGCRKCAKFRVPSVVIIVIVGRCRFHHWIGRELLTSAPFFSFFLSYIFFRMFTTFLRYCWEFQEWKRMIYIHIVEPTVAKIYVHYCTRGNRTKSFDNRLTFPRAMFTPSTTISA